MQDTTNSIIPVLFFVTFALAIAFGIWQLYRARKARLEGHRSAQARVNGEPAAPPPSSRPLR